MLELPLDKMDSMDLEECSILEEDLALSPDEEAESLPKKGMPKVEFQGDSTLSYLNEIGRNQLLTAKEERELTTLVK
ncbi:MAG TPA: sigma-70 factor domain-containing protein, partial [Sulfuricella sp.]|nr:sigma-70 factor domain-containing protein [Sulfuricella sp.]